jgi:hypothetical protein
MATLDEFLLRGARRPTVVQRIGAVLIGGFFTVFGGSMLWAAYLNFMARSLYWFLVFAAVGCVTLFLSLRALWADVRPGSR